MHGKNSFFRKKAKIEIIYIAVAPTKNEWPLSWESNRNRNPWNQYAIALSEKWSIMKDKIILAAMKQSELYLPKLNEALKDF
jgi:hypothetical protein